MALRSERLKREADALDRIERALDGLPDDKARRRAITWILDNYDVDGGQLPEDSAPPPASNGTAPAGPQHGLEGSGT